MLFVALNLPSYLFQLLPVAALIGALLGLGNLARGSELIVMRASGVTTARFCLWLGAAGLVIALAMFAIGEYVAPPLGQYARQMKVFSKFNEFSLAGNKGTWVRDGNTIISVDQQSASNRFGGIKVFRTRLAAPAAGGWACRVGAGSPATGSGAWKNYAETEFVERRHAGRAQGAGRTDHDAVAGISRPGRASSPIRWAWRDLRAYIAHLQRNELESESVPDRVLVAPGAPRVGACS